MSVLVVGACVRCGHPWQREHDGGHRPLYCSRRCSILAHNARRHGTCDVCGGTASAKTFGIVLCLACHPAIHRHCWRKRVHPTQPAPAVHADGRALHPYRCRVCPHWHYTTQPGPLADDLAVILDRAGAYLRTIGFDIATARGWANTPDGPRDLHPTT